MGSSPFLSFLPAEVFLYPQGDGITVIERHEVFGGRSIGEIAFCVKDESSELSGFNFQLQ
jgi:hypothetical protein